jgi:prepilin-type processing-associated H-X9-DG protein
MTLPPQGRDIMTIEDLILWFKLARSNNGNFAKFVHELWIPRKTSDTDPDDQAWPSPTFTRCQVPVGCPGWPRRSSDKLVGYQPIISDEAEAPGNTTNVLTIPNTQAHFYNGTLSSINVGYGDGHVDMHNGRDVVWQYIGNNNEESTFY